MRKPEILRQLEAKGTRVAGVGNDGNLYGVTQVSKKSSTYRRRPCATCPWRRDAPVGRFPAQAYRESSSTAYDAAMATFACHESGTEKPATCAGFLLRNAANNIGVRLAERLNGPIIVEQGDVSLYDSYREMAIANGVDPEDPVLAPCRADTDRWGES